MKRLMLVGVAFPFLLSLLAFAQDTTKPEAQQPTASTEKVATEVSTLSEKIGTDGKTFVSDKDNNVRVNNPDALKANEGYEATPKAQAEKRRTLSTLYPTGSAAPKRPTKCPR